MKKQEGKSKDSKIYFIIKLLAITVHFPSLFLQSLYAESIQDRFPPPNGFKRVDYQNNSFATYLQNFPLKPKGSSVSLYNGKLKTNQVHVAVLDFPLLKDDLIQCADAIIKLRAEYLYSQKKYEQIHFKISNGMNVEFSRFIKGERVQVNGNKTHWKKGKFKQGTGRDVFEEYLRFIYIYAGTISLKSELKKKTIGDLKPGNIWIEAGSPGHAVLVVDKLTGKDGQTLFLLAQSYMPSQEMHILKSQSIDSPWFKIPQSDFFQTPEWEFPTKEIYEFTD
ncbi:DUF4846 domain-containing protein [Leptospira sp. 2 VSF19]|uniref:DUF4846 domain-containing protein n=1 Tax=Leptospira soteropolitanensis TaxID=2950025 RepID=A0AAW5V6Z4_9LEPT|nr:DUF4846 domain-containing protein [Leptospira soteropolitanensis]MCW7491159.1 DUF4846 domain-containing protein [Leptospira soteropolitanensis]MCW7498743.1 DUF4846 domain-containing protein [Leptospira soteropolitanensis]MCW7521664.1 DUF4846 domain-containing protein [Leptospira soteropolitanensis]MCW7524847.1 DUF4846 domain-containing protein [Leptospira soteropolitanensis]MCW7528714.1 DUF4846 domain-containing protein [Leptospira soteropolitanensis]